MTDKQKLRSEIDKKYKWDTDSIYSTVEEWEADFAKLLPLLEPIKALKGQLNSPDKVAQVLEADDEIGLLLDKVYLYAHMLEDQDTSVGENQARMSKVRAVYAQIVGETAWIQPEILSQSDQTLNQWIQHKALEPHKRTLELLVRRKPYTLSESEETLLGHASDLFRTASEAFGKLTNADLTFKPALDQEGKEHTVTNGTAYTLALSPDRTLRENTFRSLYDGYESHQNTLCSLLAGNTKNHVFNAKTRGYESSLAASLHHDNIPTDVYHSLIKAVNDALPDYHDYLNLRAEKLGLKDDLNMWDMHVPLVPDFKLDVEWEQCEAWIKESIKPLGDEYAGQGAASFNERWYDVYENKGKRSGGYSTGAYGEKPFVLLNYHGTLSDVFTVAHELGHSMHTFLSNKNQPFRYAGYPIFLAEIASTTNEALLHDYLVRTNDAPKLKAYLLNHLCDSFRGTLIRQTMFAEFELEIHDRLEKGGALTSESLNEYYYELNAKYHGDVIKADEKIALEWSRIPHFYYNFYVYKYATGFAASQIFAQRILKGESVDKYLGFLKSGGSKDPLDTVRDAGVDLADPKVVEDCFGGFRTAVKELRDLLG